MKDKNRLDENTVLLQGISLPSPALTASEPLLPAQNRDCLAVQPIDPIVIPEPDDMSGLAAVRNRHQAPSAEVLPQIETTVGGGPTQVANRVQSDIAETSKIIPRTTQWRHNKKAEQSVGHAKGPGVAKKPRKEYGSSGCKICQESLQSNGHKQYYGSQYCPKNNVSFKQWLIDVKAAMAAKKAAMSIAAW